MATPLKWLLCALSVWLCGCAGAAYTSTEREVLSAPESFELMSLLPERGDHPPAGAGEDFHGYRVLGRAFVTDASEREELLDAFEPGVKESDGRVAKCFNPRHALRIRKGARTIDLAICFECLQSIIYEGSTERRVIHTQGAEQRFDSALAQRGLRKP